MITSWSSHDNTPAMMAVFETAFCEGRIELLDWIVDWIAGLDC